MTPADHEREDLDPSRRRGPRKGAWAEVIVVCLLVASLAGSLNLVVALHRRGAKPRPDPAETPSAPVATAMPPPESPAKPSVPPPPVEVPRAPEIARPEPPAVDPTKKALAELEAATATELEEAKKADRRAEAMEKGRRASVAESERWRRRESLIRGQVATLNEKAHRIDKQVEAIALERDVLARERDELKAALTGATSKSSFAVLPFKGANGTWQRPIVLECEDGSVTLQPRGLNFSMLDLNPHLHPRASIVVQTIARELTVMEAAGSPDGAPVVPYLVFIVRPDGIRAYYEARARLEPLGISFGYELVPQDLKINFPDLTDLETWDGTVPLNVPSHKDGRGSNPSPGGSGPAAADPIGDLAMNGGPGASGGARKGTAGDAWASGARANGGDTPNDYIWPSRPGGGRGYGAEMGDALAPPRSPRTGVPSATAPGAGGRGTGATSTDRGGIGDGPPSQPGGGPSSTPGQGGFSPGIWATPGDGSGDSPRPGGVGGGTRPFTSRGPQGRDAGGSEFGFGQLPGSPSGASGSARGGAGGRGSSPVDDLAGLLEPVPGTSSGGNLGSMVEGWTGVPGSSRPGGGAVGKPGGPNGAPESGEAGGGPGGTGPGRGTRGTAGTAPRPGPRGTAGGDPASGQNPGAGSDPAGGDPLAGSDGEAAARGPTGPMSGLSSSLLPTPPPDGIRGGYGASGSSSSPRGSTSAGGSPSGSPGTSGASPSGAGFGLPSSLSPSMGASGSSGGSGSSAGSSPAQKPSDDFLADLPPLLEPERKEPLRIEVPFEVVIDCQKDGIEILPGGNRITMKMIQAGSHTKGEKGQELLTRHLRSLERKRAIVDPMIRPKPRVKFIVEPGGDETYLAVRRQLLFSGLDWPLTVQLVEGQASRYFPREVW